MPKFGDVQGVGDRQADIFSDGRCAILAESLVFVELGPQSPTRPITVTPTSTAATVAIGYERILIGICFELFKKIKTGEFTYEVEGLSQCSKTFQMKENPDCVAIRMAYVLSAWEKARAFSGGRSGVFTIQFWRVSLWWFLEIFGVHPPHSCDPLPRLRSRLG